MIMITGFNIDAIDKLILFYDILSVIVVVIIFGVIAIVISNDSLL